MLVNIQRICLHNITQFKPSCHGEPAHKHRSLFTVFIRMCMKTKIKTSGPTAHVSMFVQRMIFRICGKYKNHELAITFSHKHE